MRKSLARIALVSVCIAMVPVVTGCPVGYGVRSFEPAHGPKGIATTIELNDKAQLAGEVLQVRTDTLLVRTVAGPSIVLVPISTIKRARFRSMTDGIQKGRWRGFGTQDAVRLSSRFPHGLADEHLQKLLAETGQTAPVLIDK